MSEEKQPIKEITRKEPLLTVKTAVNKFKLHKYHKDFMLKKYGKDEKKESEWVKVLKKEKVI